MAAKKIQEYVKGKINNSNVGHIHFSSNGQQERSFLNISKFQQSFDDKELLSKKTEQEAEFFYSVEPKLQFTSDLTDEFNSNAQTPSSTKSSPDSKPKWGTHITDVKKNINNAVEDAYSVLNTLLKDNVNKADSKSYPLDNDISVSVEKQQQSTIRPSKTMSNIDKISVIEDSTNESATYNKSLDNLTVDKEISDKSLDVDSVDFKWLPTPKNIKRYKSKGLSKKFETTLPQKFHKNLIENYQFPVAKIDSSNQNNSKIGWPVIAGIFILVLSMVFINVQVFFGFSIGLVSCLWFLNHFGFLNLQTNNHIVSLPTLKNLHSPSIPHIEKDNFDDRDLHATEDSSFSGWMNLLFLYDVNTYNINHCCVVHVNIEQDGNLRIRRPKQKVAHRAFWSESQYSAVSFTSEIIVSLENAKIDLEPRDLVKKRLWSKKYPIYIELAKSLGEYSTEKSNFETLNSKSTCLYLFGRTCREKEEWFRRLVYASRSVSLDLNMWNIIQKYLTRQKNSFDETGNVPISGKPSETSARRSSAVLQTDDDSKKVTYHNLNKEEDENQELVIETNKSKHENKIPQLAEYVKYMSKFMPADLFLLTSEVMRLDINYVTCNPEILCINAFLGRMFWDFFRGSHWVEIIRNKIQCKLKKMHLPQFIDQLTVVDIHLGKEIPLIRKFGRPFLDSRGLWCDAEIAYTGGFSMILETKINLFNLRTQLKKNAADEASGKNGSPEHNSDLNKEEEDRNSKSQNLGAQSNKTAAFASSEEDSAESSSASEDSGDESNKHETVWLDDNHSRQTSQVTPTTNQAGGGGGSSKRIIRWVDKIARSSYFIKAADNKYIQRGMELVSNTKLMLQVEVHSICGTLALNIPPPPSDRLWFGFRPSPVLKMSAKPKVGQKEISISKITELIEKKLILEFQKVLVLPNMDDVPLPLLMNGSIDNYSTNL